MTVTFANGASITFDPVRHEYRTADGRLVPGVTNVLHATGVSTDFEGLKEQSDRLAWQIDAKRNLGTAVHADAHAFDDNDLVWSTVHPDVAPYIHAWADFLEHLRLVPIVRERILYHPVFHYAGTLDAICQMRDFDRRVLVDIKIGDPESAAAAYQTAAYESAYLAQHPGLTIEERWAVRLVPDAKVPYRVVDYTARPDAYLHFFKFQSFLTTYQEQACRRARA